jgi:hypothetical protein
MGQALYQVVGHDGAWVVEHDGIQSQSYATKEAAFEAAVAPASNALHAGHEVIIKVPGQQSAEEPWLGQHETPE